MTDFLNLNLITRTWLLMAETRDLKMGTPANHPVSGFPLSSASLPWGRDVIAITSVGGRI
jgi:hypothetical protein